MSTKISPKDVLQSIKADEKNKVVKENYTFRLDPEMMEKFQRKCDSEKIKMVRVLERYIKNFIGEE